MFKKTLLIAGASYFLIQKKIYCSPEPPLSMILRGAYENKIRRFSPPEKIFDVFATEYENGRLYMSIIDLLKAICFYNYSYSDQNDVQKFMPAHITKFLGKQSKFQIYDYFILARFLAFDKDKMRQYFEKNNLYEMTQSQFKQFLSKQVCPDYVNHIKQSILVQSRQFKPSYDEFDSKTALIAKSMLDGRQAITLRQLQQYRKLMVQQLYQFEFLMFPAHDDAIDGVDFARSIIKYVQPSKTKKYMKRIKKMHELENVKVDMKAYKAFHIYIWANMKQIERILNERGAISTNQLSELINKFTNKKGTITNEQINVVVKMLDHDDSGFLQKKEVLGVLKNLQYYTTVKSGETTFIESLKQDAQHLYEKFKKIEEIIEQ